MNSVRINSIPIKALKALEVCSEALPEAAQRSGSKHSRQSGARRRARLLLWACCVCVCVHRAQGHQTRRDPTHPTARKTWSSICVSKTSPSTTVGCKGILALCPGVFRGREGAATAKLSKTQGASDSVPCSTMESLAAASDPQLVFLFNDKAIWELKARGKPRLIQASSLL